MGAAGRDGIMEMKAWFLIKVCENSGGGTNADANDIVRRRRDHLGWSGSCLLLWIWFISSLILEILSSPHRTEELEVSGTPQIKGKKKRIIVAKSGSETPTGTKLCFPFKKKKFKIRTVLKMKKHKSDSSLFTHCFCFLPRAGLGCINTSWAPYLYSLK